MKKDITTKETIKTITEDIAQYILKLKIEDVEFVDKELQRIEKREADIVAICKIDKVESILHIEIQNNNDYTMHRRMMRYYTDIKQRFDNLEVHQYLIYIGKEKLSMQDNIVERNIKFRYNIIDMHTIDCEEFIRLDTPDALVLSILCDFKDRDELNVLTYILQRLEELTKEDEHKLGKYMLILDTLSTNRNLQDKLKEAEEMLRTVKIEDLPSYQIAIERSKEKWVSTGAIETAITMIKEFNLSIEQVAVKLNISVDELKKHLNK